MGRRPCCEKVGLKKGRWTAEEDERLMKYIQANGEGCWRSLPKNAGLLRCGKSCRLRWINYLRSDLKRGNITSEEEDVIIKLHASIGNRWSLIASHLPGRTDNEIKNYWNSHLSRKIHTFRRRTNNEAAPVIIDVAKLNLPPRRRGGRRGCKVQSPPPKVMDRPEKTSTEVEQTEEIPFPPTPELERELLMVLDDPAERANEERENVAVDVGMEGRNKYEEERHERDVDGGLLCCNDILDDESLDLDWLLTYEEWDESKNESIGTCESQNAASTGEVETGNFTDCNPMNSFSVDSPWDWESVVQGHEIWNEDSEIKEAQGILESEAVGSPYHDALVTWLLS